MRTLSFICVSMLTAAPALAQVRVEVVGPPPPHVVVAAPPPPRVVVAPPVVRFDAPPPMVEVQPGVQVVRDCDEEVFLSGGWYWHAGPDGTWYRTRSYRGGWVAAPRHQVPVALVRMPRGQYRRFHGEERREEHMRHEERREERGARHEERREEKREQKAEHRWEKHHGRRG